MHAQSNLVYFDVFEGLSMYQELELFCMGKIQWESSNFQMLLRGQFFIGIKLACFYVMLAIRMYACLAT